MTRTNRLKLEASPGQALDNPNAGSSGGPSRSTFYITSNTIKILTTCTSLDRESLPSGPAGAAAHQTPAPGNHSKPPTGNSLTGPQISLAPSPYAIDPSTNINIGIRARTSALDAVADSILAVIEDEQRRTLMPVATPLDGPVPKVSFRHPVVSNPYAAGTFVMHSPVSAVAGSERTVQINDMLQRAVMLMQEMRDFAGLHPTTLHIQDLEDFLDTIPPRLVASVVVVWDLELSTSKTSMLQFMGLEGRISESALTSAFMCQPRSSNRFIQQWLQGHGIQGGSSETEGVRPQ